MASYNHHHLEADLMLLGWIVLIITVVGILLIIRTNLYYQASIWEIDLEVGWSYSNLHLGFPSPQCEFHLQYQRCQMISDTYLYYQIEIPYETRLHSGKDGCLGFCEVSEHSDDWRGHRWIRKQLRLGI